MAVQLFGISAFQIAGTPATVIHGMTAQPIDYNGNPIRLGVDGSPRSTFGAIMSLAPEVQLTTIALKTALTACGPLGLAIAAANKVTLFHQAITGGLPASSGHESVAINCGLLVPETLTLQQGDGDDGVASLDYRLYTAYDGTNDILVHGTSATLPTAVDLSEAYTLGPVDLDGVTRLESVERVQINFGLEVSKHAYNGSPFPSVLTIDAVRPTIRVDLAEPKNLSEIGLDGGKGTAGVVYAQAIDEYGLREDPTTEVHISISLGDFFTVPVQDPATQRGRVGSSFMMLPVKPTTANELVIDTTAAIPAIA